MKPAIPHTRPSTEHGFTLVELMIVVAIIAILASIAVPSYTAYVQRTHRAHARAALLNVAQYAERVATATGSYPAANANVPDAIKTVEGRRYTATYTFDNPGFTVKAARVAGAGNATDDCGTFVLQSSGTRTVEDKSDKVTAEQCWSR